MVNELGITVPDEGNYDLEIGERPKQQCQIEESKAKYETNAFDGESLHILPNRED